MKKSIISLLVIVALTILSFTSRATNVSGGIHVNTTWTLANSPYIVVDTVVVFPGITLTIQSGVVVKFNNNMRLEIRGTLMALGTSSNPITFTSNSGTPTPGSWGSIYFNQCQTSKLNYCNILYSDKGAFPAAGTYMGDTIYIKHSNFTNNNSGMGNIGLVYVYIDSCNFRNNNKGIESGSGVVYASNSTFSSNQYGIGYSNVEYGSFRHCLIDSNSIMGIFAGQRDTIIDCQINYNGIGMRSSGPGYITKNRIENNSIGISLYSTSSSMFCNKICGNTSYDCKYTGSTNTNLVVNNYWCTSDSTATAAVIYDGYDNVNLGLVNFMPLDTSSCYLSGCNLYTTSTITNATCATCPTGSATAIVHNGFAPYTYTWYSAPIQNTQTATSLPSGRYSICVTDANGCSACDTIFVDSTNCTGFSIVPNSTNASCTTCADGTAKVIPTGGTAPYHYTWYTSPMQTTDSISGLIHGTYHVCVTDANGCISCDSTTVNVGSCSAHYNLYSTATPHYYTAVNMASGAAPLTYYWSWGDGTHDTAAYPSHTYAATGFYNICLTITDNAGCTNTYCSSYYLLRPQSQMVYVNVISNTTVGINQLIADNSISIYPNPFTSQTTISFSTEQTNTSIKITDVIGKEIKTINFTGAQYILEKGIMKPGIYFVQITSFDKLRMTQEVVNRKVVVQ